MPFDAQVQMRVRLETNAYYLILQALQSVRYSMIVSPVHFEEANAISDAEERQKIMCCARRSLRQRPTFSSRAMIDW